MAPDRCSTSCFDSLHSCTTRPSPFSFNLNGVQSAQQVERGRHGRRGRSARLRLHRRRRWPIDAAAPRTRTAGGSRRLLLVLLLLLLLLLSGLLLRLLLRLLLLLRGVGRGGSGSSGRSRRPGGRHGDFVFVSQRNATTCAGAEWGGAGRADRGGTERFEEAVAKGRKGAVHSGTEGAGKG